MTTRMRAGWLTCYAWAGYPKDISTPRPNGRYAICYASAQIWSVSIPPMSSVCKTLWRVIGVPAVLEQKTTICCKLLCLLTSKQGVSPAYSRERTHVEAVEENPFYELNPTLSVGNIRTLLPRYAWTKPFVFLHSLTVYQRCVVFCTLTTGTPPVVTEMECA